MANGSTNIVSRKRILPVILKLLFIQGLLNRKGMQNLGFASIIASALGNEISSDNGFFKRHAEFFNCNPNFTSLVIGGVVRLEEERSMGKPITDEDIEYFKRSISSPLAAMGDMLFLGNLKPLALTFACIFAIYKSAIGLLAIFLLYNATIMCCRVGGVYFGYSKGWELVEVFSSPTFQRVLNAAQSIGASAGGVLIAIIAHHFLARGSWVSFSATALAILTIILMRKDISASWFAVFLFLISVLLSITVS